MPDLDSPFRIIRALFSLGPRRARATIADLLKLLLGGVR